DSYIIDYPSENKNIDNLIDDLKKIRPDIIFISSTDGALIDDYETFKIIKQILPTGIIIAKGALFSTLTYNDLNDYEKYIEPLDYAVKGEAEATLNEFLKYFDDKSKRETACGLIYKKENKWIIPEKLAQLENLDVLPFPARDLMKNELYIRPDTGKPMATIESSRGCPANCIYCLTPIISGKNVRYRSADNIISELEECIAKYNITDFFFRSDTFTINKKWVCELCDKILEKKINIRWVANARVKPLDKETLEKMKKAGCWLIAFGIESGSDESLKKMKKGATVEDAKNSVNLAKNVGLQIYGFFMLGFPWETKNDIKKTIDFAIELDCDFAEFHIATAFKGTELYNSISSKKINIGANYFGKPTETTENFTVQELLDFRRQAIKKFYLRPRYIYKKL
ncbi:MAG TPA: radical SAM protein, partial [bacterium]|nr:radical SAM protein [bacterium]